MPTTSRQTGDSPRSQAVRVLAHLRQLLGSGEIEIGDRLPSEKRLQEKYGVSRTVVREALARLRAEGRSGTKPVAEIPAGRTLLNWIEQEGRIIAPLDDGPYEISDGKMRKV